MNATWIKIKNKFAFLENKQSLFYYFLQLVGLALLMCSIVLIMERGTIPLGGDYVQQQIPFYTNGYDDWWKFIRTGTFPLWDSNTVLGVNNIGSNCFYYFLNPFFFPILLFPRSLIPQGLAILMVIKMALAGLTFRTYLKYLGVEEKTARVFAVAYAFCGWNLYYLWFNHFMEVVVLFPLVLLGIEKVLKERRPFVLMSSLFVLGIANYFFLVVTCFVGVVYAVFRFFQTIKTRDVKNNFLAGAIGVTGFVVGLMMCALVLLPCLSAIQGVGRVANATYLKDLQEAWSKKNIEQLIKLLLDFDNTKKRYYPLVTYFFPVTGDFNTVLFRNTGYDNTLSSLFVYTPLIILVVPSIIESVRRKKVSHIIAIASIILMLFTPFVYQLFQGFTKDYGRWQLFVTASLITYVAVNFKNVKKFPKWYFDISVLVVLICMVYTVLTSLKYQYQVTDYKETFGIVIYQFIYVLVIYLIIRWKSHAPSFTKLLGALLTIEVLIVGNFTLFGQKTSYDYLAGGVDNFNDEVAVVKKINQSDKTYFRIFNTTANDSTNNLGMREGYNGVGGFHSIYNSNITDFLHWTRIIYSDETWTMGAHEKILNIDEFLGVKYYIVKNSDFNTVDNDDPSKIINVKEMYNVPLGFKYKEELSTKLHSVFENENFIELGYSFDNIITVGSESIQNDNKSASLFDYMQAIKNEEALLRGAILYDIDAYGVNEKNTYDKETIKVLNEFAESGKVSDYNTYAGKLYLSNDLIVDRYDCFAGVGNSAKELLDTSNAQRIIGNSQPYRYGVTKYIIKATKGNICSTAKEDGGCYIGLKLNLDRYAYVHLIDENDEMITFDYHQYINNGYKLIRGFYTDRPIKAIVVKPMINEVDYNRGISSFAVYEETYASFLQQINKLKAYPLENVVVTTNGAKFTTNFDHTRIVVTTIPYDAGWSLTIKDSNGNETKPEIFKGQGGFCSFIAPSGNISYKMSYYTPNLKKGIMITLAGFVLFFSTFASYALVDKFKNKKLSNSIDNK